MNKKILLYFLFFSLCHPLMSESFKTSNLEFNYKNIYFTTISLGTNELPNNICNWIGGTGNWEDSFNWDCGIVPSSGDEVIINGGEVILTTPVEVAKITITEGIGNMSAKLSGSSALTVTDEMNWNVNSTLGAITIPLFIANGAVLNILGSGQSLENLLTNNGIVNHNNALLLNSIGKIINNGTYNWNSVLVPIGANPNLEIENNGQFLDGGGFFGTQGSFPVVFNNNGFARLTGSTGIPDFIDFDVNNFGDLEVSHKINQLRIFNEGGNVTIGNDDNTASNLQVESFQMNGGNLYMDIVDVPLFVNQIQTGNDFIGGPPSILSGTLNLSLKSGFTPTVGAEYPLINNFSGTFQTVNFPVGTSGWAIDYSSKPNFVKLIIGSGFDCPTLNKNVGDACDDGNICTTNDLVQADCSCVGTFQDSDNDGTCDAQDLCNGGPEPDSPCDDGDICTINDLVQADCSCAGTFQDSDNDGTCDAQDLCNGGPEPDSPCDDGNPNTSGEIILADCSCGGGSTIFDCPTISKNIGDACDDGDICTTKDIVQADCSCAGTFQDSDSDGTCDAQDLCNGGPEPDTPCDDGNPNTTGEIILADCSCGGGTSIFDCPSLQKNVGDSCDDNNPNTENDVVQANCNCMGTETGGEIAGVNCGGISVTTQAGQITINGLVSAGEKVELQGLFGNYAVQTICDQDCPNPLIIPNLVAGNYKIKVQMFGANSDYCFLRPEPIVTVTEFTCMDDDNDGTCNENDVCANAPEPGTACNDGNPNTFNDIIQPDCSCAGQAITFDCPNLQKNIGDACDDGNNATVNDQIQADCTCAGEEPSGEIDGVACEGMKVTGQAGQIKVENLVAGAEKVQIIGAPTNWQVLNICDGNCANPLIIPNLAAGEYTVKLQMFGNNGDYCYQNPEPKVIVTDFTCMDDDNDGICNEDDVCANAPEPGTACNDGNPNTFNDVIQPDCSCSGQAITYDCPNLQKNIGDACDDGDETTSNDVIQADCSCAGNETGEEIEGVNCGGVSVTAQAGQITVSGLVSAGEKVELQGLFGNYSVNPVCDGDCSNPLIIPNLVAGEYKVKVQMFGQNSTYCFLQPEPIVTVPNGLNAATNRDGLQSSTFTIFPNPAQEEVTLIFNQKIEESIQLRVYNYLGKAMLSQKYEKRSDAKIKLDLTNFTNGIYFIQTKVGKNPIRNKKLIINRLY